MASPVGRPVSVKQERARSRSRSRGQRQASEASPPRERPSEVKLQERSRSRDQQRLELAGVKQRRSRSRSKERPSSGQAASGQRRVNAPSSPRENPSQDQCKPVTACSPAKAAGGGEVKNVTAPAADTPKASQAVVRQKRLNAIHDLLDAVLADPLVQDSELTEIGTRICIAMAVRGAGHQRAGGGCGEIKIDKTVSTPPKGRLRGAFEEVIHTPRSQDKLLVEEELLKTPSVWGDVCDWTVPERESGLGTQCMEVPHFPRPPESTRSSEEGRVEDEERVAAGQRRPVKNGRKHLAKLQAQLVCARADEDALRERTEQAAVQLSSKQLGSAAEESILVQVEQACARVKLAMYHRRGLEDDIARLEDEIIGGAGQRRRSNADGE